MKPHTPAARTALSPLSATACCGVILLAVVLTGCDPTDPKPPRPETGAAAVPTIQPPPPPASDASLPDARSALARPGGDGERTTQSGATLPSTMTPQQESTQMPLPGQANNYSPPESAQRAGQGGAAASAGGAAKPAPG